MTDTDIDSLERMARNVEPPARNVVEALIRVIRDMPAVDKGERMDLGSTRGYNFRGIEQVTAAAQPLFGKHGVLVCPRVLESATEAITKGSAPWVHRTMKIEYILRGPLGEKDYIQVGPFIAEADDNSDKSANKCMTQAYKQMLLQVLCISDRKDDPDSANQNRDALPADPATEPVSRSVVDQVVERARLDGYTETELAEVMASVTGRDDWSAFKGEWPAIRDAWVAYKAQNPRQGLQTADTLPAPATEPSGGLSEDSGAPVGNAETGSRARKRTES